MKDSDVPELAYAWWKKNQPATLPSTGLGDALKAYEAARAKAVPARAPEGVDAALDAYDAALAAQDDLTPAVAKAKAKCNKVLHATCLRVLGKYDGVIENERTALANERKKNADVAAEAIETCKSECAKVLSAVIDAVKVLEKKLGELERTAADALENRDAVAAAVAREEPNAGEMEVHVADAQLKDGTREYNELVRLAESARADTNKAWKLAFKPKLTKLDGQIQRLADRVDQQSASFELAREKAETAFASIQKAVKAVHDLADGVGDKEEQFVSVLESLNTRTIKSIQTVTGRFAEAGGQLDRVKFNILNYTTQGERDFGKREVLEEAKISLKRGLELAAEGKRELTQARTAFGRALNDLPGFVTARNPKFRGIFQELAKTRSGLDNLEKENRKVGESAVKETERFQKTVKEAAL